MVNNNLLQEERLGKMFMVKVGPNYERTRKAFEPALSRWSEIIEKTADLFVRMNTDQAEVVATVMFAADSLQKADQANPSEIDVLNSVMQWKQKRRPPLDQGVVASTIRNLGMLHWLHVKPDDSLPVPDEEAILA